MKKWMVPLSAIAAAAAAWAAVWFGLDALDGPEQIESAKPQSAWESIDGDGFTAKLPGQASHTVEEAQTPAGKLPVEMFIYEADEDAVSVQGTRFPTDTPIDLDGAVEGAAQATSSTIAESSKTTLAGEPGRSFRFLGKWKGEDVTSFGSLAAKDGVMVIVQYIVWGKGIAAPPAAYEKVRRTVAFE